MESSRVNVADRLRISAEQRPDAPAIVEAWGKQRRIAFGALDRDADLLARGLIEIGIEPQLRMALLVKPSIEFVTLVFALLRSGATMVLVDSGLGAKNIVRCLASTEPDGFVAIPQGQVLRILKRKEFSQAKFNVTVGRRWFWGGETLGSLRRTGEGASTGQTALSFPHTAADDPAAIVFTSGSTGPPKGVVYRHETFATQLAEIEQMYGLTAGGVDLACFPLFGLFNVALGITTVLPEMDFSRPAAADPKKLLAAANQFEVTQSFASPAVWDKLSRHCEQSGEQIPTLTKVFSCGAPVPASVMQRTLAMVHPEAEMHTPYGATESLPVSTIEAKEIIGETQVKTEEGAGVCVGRKVDSIEWRIVKITDEPIATITDTEELPRGEIGELIVRGPQVCRKYLARSPRRELGGEPSAAAGGYNELAKITDGDSVWHRMGDVGYLDEQQRFWYCGRKSHRVVTSEGTLFTAPIEAPFNTLPLVQRTALVGIGRTPRQVPALVYEPVSFEGLIGRAGHPSRQELEQSLESDIHEIVRQNPLAAPIEYFLPHSKLPTDIRHNAKINREQLAQWATKQLNRGNTNRH